MKATQPRVLPLISSYDIGGERDLDASPNCVKRHASHHPLATKNSLLSPNNSESIFNSAMALSAALFQQPIHIKPRPHCSPRRRSGAPVARLFGPAIFEASKLKVLRVGVDEEKEKGSIDLPRAYTLTHSDITSKITLAISNTINQAQLKGWYNRLQRDEVVAEWRKIQGSMSLHVHCHISGGHFLLDLVANLRYYIFCKELPVVLMAFAYGDKKLFTSYPELEEAMVWVYFHSNIPKFNKVECWGPLRDAATGRRSEYYSSDEPLPVDCTIGRRPCQAECDCCFPPTSLIPWPSDPQEDVGDAQYQQQ